MIKEYGLDEVGKILKKAGKLIYFCFRLAIPRRRKSSMHDPDTGEKIADVVVWMWFLKTFKPKLIPSKKYNGDWEIANEQQGNV